MQRALVRRARVVIGVRGAEASGGEREGGSVCDGARLMRPSIASPHPHLDLRNQLMMATGEDTQWVTVRQARAARERGEGEMSEGRSSTYN